MRGGVLVRRRHGMHWCGRTNAAFSRSAKYHARRHHPWHAVAAEAARPHSRCAGADTSAPTSRVSPDTGVGSHAASQALVDQDQPDPHAVGRAHRPQARGRLTGGSGAGHRGAERDPGGLTGASTRLALPAHAPPVRGRRGEGARCLSAGVESMERPFNGSGGRRSPTAKCSLEQSLSAARRRVGDRLPAC